MFKETFYVFNSLKTFPSCLVTSTQNTTYFMLSFRISRIYYRGDEWYLEKRGSRKILAGSRNLGSVFDKSRSLVFAWFVFTFFESRNFLPKSLGLGFLTRISASRRVSDFTIRHPLLCDSDHFFRDPWVPLTFFPAATLAVYHFPIKIREVKIVLTQRSANAHTKRFKPCEAKTVWACLSHSGVSSDVNYF